MIRIKQISRFLLFISISSVFLSIFSNFHPFYFERTDFSNSITENTNQKNERIQSINNFQNKSPDTSQNQGYDKKAGVIPNRLNVSESCQTIYNMSNFNMNNLVYPAPANFTTANSQIFVNVKNSTQTTTIVEDTTATSIGIYNQTAQEFNFSVDVFLEGFTIYTGSGGKPVSRAMEIRNATYNGTSIYSFTTDAFSTKNVWASITFSSMLFLPAGRYFLWMAKPAASNEVSWLTGNIGTQYNQSDTWYYDSNLGEWVSANYDSTLKTHFYACVNPESVEMTIDGYSIHNIGNGRGFVELGGNITNKQVNHSITTNSSIQFKYSVSAMFYNQKSYSPNYDFVESDPIWNCSIQTAQPDINFEYYYANITGLPDNYYDLDIYNNQSEIIKVPISANSVRIFGNATNMIWRSPNYIQSYQIPETIYSGQTIQINTTLLSSGNFTIEIFDPSVNRIYSNNSLGMSANILLWNVNTNHPSGQYNITWFYNESFGIGFAESSFVLMKQAIISTNEINAFVFDQIMIQNNFTDMYSFAPLTAATMTYSLDLLSDTMDENSIISGLYYDMIDLSLFALAPGEYTIYYRGEKAGYQTIMSTSKLHLAPRPIQIEIVQSQVSILPGNSIDFEINIGENNTLESLKRPVTISFSVSILSDLGEKNIIFSKIVSGVSQKTNFTWQTDSTLEPGQYMINAEIQSQFYVTSKSAEKSLTIIDPDIVAQDQFRLQMTILASTIIPIAFVLIINFNVIKPYRRRKLNELVKRTQIIEDAIQLKGFLIISKESGICSWTYLINKMQGDTSLVSGFLQALFIFSSQFGNEAPEIDNDIGGYVPEHENNAVEFDVVPNNENIIDPNIPISNNLTNELQPISDEKPLGGIENALNCKTEDILEYNYNHRNFLIVSGQFFRFVVILTGRASPETRLKAQNFIHRFETENSLLVSEWKGDIDAFKKPAGELIQELFPLSFVKLFEFTKSNILEEFKQNILRKERAHKKQILHIFSVMESLIQTQLSFKISTVLGLLQESDKLFAKDLILRMVTQNILVEFIPTTSQITRFNPHTKTRKIVNK